MSYQNRISIRALLGAAAAFALFAASLFAATAGTVSAQEDPAGYCTDLVGVATVTVEEARSIESTCDGFETSDGKLFFVTIVDEYVSQPLDALIRVEVVELAPAVSVTPTPTPTPTTFTVQTATLTPPSTAPTIVSVPVAISIPVAVPGPVVLPVVASATVTQPLVALTSGSATSFGWSATGSTAHAATVKKTGATALTVSFTG